MGFTSQNWNPGYNSSPKRPPLGIATQKQNPRFSAAARYEDMDYPETSGSRHRLRKDPHFLRGSLVAPHHVCLRYDFAPTHPPTWCGARGGGFPPASAGPPPPSYTRHCAMHSPSYLVPRTREREGATPRPAVDPPPPPARTLAHRATPRSRTLT